MLWLDTRGSVCPITGKVLTKDQLKQDTKLRSRLIQWNIARMKSAMLTPNGAMHANEDDLYDF